MTTKYTNNISSWSYMYGKQSARNRIYDFRSIAMLFKQSLNFNLYIELIILKQCIQGLYDGNALYIKRSYQTLQYIIIMHLTLEIQY